MAQTLAVGTVVEFGGRRLMVVGYNMVEDEGHVGLAYLVVPCPLGYVSPDSMLVVRARELEAGLADPGYAGEDALPYLQALDDMRTQGEKVPADEWQAALQAVTAGPVADQPKEGVEHA